MLLPGCQSCSWGWSLSLWVVRSWAPQSVCGDHTAPGRQPSSSNPFSNVMTHTNPNNLLKHVLQHSAQWCVKANYPVQSERVLGGSSQAGGRDKGHKGNTSQRCLKTPATVTWDLEREGGERGEEEGGDWECEWEREGGQHVSDSYVATCSSQESYGSSLGILKSHLHI